MPHDPFLWRRSFFPARQSNLVKPRLFPLLSSSRRQAELVSYRYDVNIRVYDSVFIVQSVSNHPDNHDRYIIGPMIYSI